jgi:2'-5' RNA ligase
MPLAQIRLFIAVSLSQELKEELAILQSRLKRLSLSWVKWVDPERIHITLKFIGDTPADKIETIKAAMTEAVKSANPFNLKFEGLGVFPNPTRAQVIWVGLGGDRQKLVILQQRLERRLETIGFPAENREYTAHLTLGRVHRNATKRQQEEIGRLVGSTNCCLNSELVVESICLMKSQLTPQGPIYTQLAKVPLNNYL